MIDEKEILKKLQEVRDNVDEIVQHNSELLGRCSEDYQQHQENIGKIAELEDELLQEIQEGAYNKDIIERKDRLLNDLLHRLKTYPLQDVYTQTLVARIQEEIKK